MPYQRNYKREREREELAEARDRRDRERLTQLDQMVQTFMDAISPLLGPLEHPYRTWDPALIIDDLELTRREIARELGRLKGPLVIEDDE